MRSKHRGNRGLRPLLGRVGWQFEQDDCMTLVCTPPGFGYHDDVALYGVVVSGRGTLVEALFVGERAAWPVDTARATIAVVGCHAVDTDATVVVSTIICRRS